MGRKKVSQITEDLNKTTETTIEKVNDIVKEVEKENYNPEPIIFKKHIISDKEVDIHSKADMLPSTIVGKMTPGTSYIIVEEFSNVYGAFYKLENNSYVTKNENYTIYFE